jgi:hypothetical protein
VLSSSGEAGENRLDHRWTVFVETGGNMSEEILRQQLYAAYKNRGMMYYHIFQAKKQQK